MLSFAYPLSIACFAQKVKVFLGCGQMGVFFATEQQCCSLPAFRQWRIAKRHRRKSGRACHWRAVNYTTSIIVIDPKNIFAKTIDLFGQLCYTIIRN